MPKFDKTTDLRCLSHYFGRNFTFVNCGGPKGGIRTMDLVEKVPTYYFVVKTKTDYCENNPTCLLTNLIRELLTIYSLLYILLLFRFPKVTSRVFTFRSFSLRLTRVVVERVVVFCDLCQ